MDRVIKSTARRERFPILINTSNRHSLYLTKILEVNSDLVHPAGARLTEDDTGFAVVREPLEFGPTVFAFGRDTAYSDFVAHHLNGFAAYHRLVTALSV